MQDARTALNMLLSTWGTDTPNLWTVELVSVNLEDGVNNYAVAADTIMVLDAYIRTGDLGDAEALTDRIIWPLSRTEYAATPNKNLESPPTSFWFDRQLSPTITLWPVPDATHTSDAANQLQYYRCTVIEDAEAPNGVTLDIPRWWQLATAVGLAELLSMSYAPDRTANLKIKAKELLMNAQEQDVENTPLYVLPLTNSYYPR